MTDRERPSRAGCALAPVAGIFAAVLVPVGVAWVIYNRARWGTWNDIGYTLWYHQDQAGFPTGSPFRLEYLPYQIVSFFVQTPTWIGDVSVSSPRVFGRRADVDVAGVGARVLSRARRFVGWPRCGSLRCSRRSRIFLYYVNGFAQFGMRHALDFEPFLVALMMLAVRDRFPRWGYVLVAYSVVVGLWGCLVLERLRQNEVSTSGEPPSEGRRCCSGRATARAAAEARAAADRAGFVGPVAQR